MAFVAPCMAITLVPFAIMFEGAKLLRSPLLFSQLSTTLVSLFWVAFGAVLAFGLTLSEFWLVKHTSGLTLSVAGIAKEIFTIMIAVICVPGNHLSTVNVLGLLVSIAGIAYYNMIKLKKNASTTSPQGPAPSKQGYEPVAVTETDIDRL
ncbi:uncharacterized protein MONBRDRAFT_36149 [Monosiga brevicollis MX1]|uniref:Sugar phosphate transporter domain-containing protein n=1 Tax=Monosiga brevicollis TaxID=81824 RepID=A9UTD7_MONBE|nr:uncharacterized protein MONBRDRAFT_36149 [Monosiga brevicollis MX1]EDQ91230.1 predicted protein [Monosiga brevicollis MX1]|eukprot:XP_001743652.1 hypothetical protein [Monosiga brevicollis MX1]